MGVYSSLAAEMAADIIPVKEHVNPIQFAIDCHRDDLQLFEALIERDIMNAYGESGIIAINEDEKATVDKAAKDGIITKIKALIEKAIEMFKSIVSSISTKIAELAQTDKKIYEKFGDLSYDKVKDCPIKGKTINYQVVEELNKKLEKSGDLGKLAEDLDSLFDFNTTDTDFSDANNKAREIKEAFEKEVGKFNEQMKSSVVVNDDSTVAERVKDKITEISNKIKNGYKGTEKDINEAGKKDIESLKSQLNELKKSERNSETTEAEISKLQCQKDLLSKVIAMKQHMLTLKISLTRKVIAVERANYIVLGNWVLKQEKVQDKKEDTTANTNEDIDVEAKEIQEAYILTESSNNFVESIFNMI